jgi:phytoene dehydrogenase-like protein
VPYERPDGRSWDEAKREFADRVIAQMGNYIDNVPEVVLEYHCDSPVDMERTSPSFFRGDLHGIATTTYQSGSHRPTPELGQYRVPGTRATLPRRPVPASRRRACSVPGAQRRWSWRKIRASSSTGSLSA